MSKKNVTRIFGYVFEEILDTYSISVRVISEYIEVDYNTVYKWKKSKNVEPKTLLNNSDIKTKFIKFIIEKVNIISSSNSENSINLDFMSKIKCYISNIKDITFPDNIKRYILEITDISQFIEKLIINVLEYNVCFYEEHIKRCSLYDMGKKYIKPTHERTRAVFFDFDGTIVSPHSKFTTWERIWHELGYTYECNYYFREFASGKIEHQKWCDITKEHFIKREFSYKIMCDIADSLQIIDGFSETLEYLTSKYIKIFILSGSINEVIRRRLKNHLWAFSGISSNHMCFNEDGFLKKIIGTKYDFKTKYEYIREVSNYFIIPVNEILFIGDSGNDEKVNLSGCRTLCINPKNTNPMETMHWHDTLPQCNNMEKILEFL